MSFDPQSSWPPNWTPVPTPNGTLPFTPSLKGPPSHSLSQVQPLAPSLQTNLKPLAWIVFLLIGGLLPFLYIKSMAVDTQNQALSKAESLAIRFTHHARQSPQLWAYQTHRLFKEVETHLSPLETVQIDLVHKERFFFTSSSPHSVLESEGTPFFKGSAFIQLHKQRIGLVHVWIPSSFSFQSQFWIWVVCLLLGTILAFSLYFIPIQAIQKGDQMNATYWEEIESLNQSLEHRVHERTQILEFLNRRILQIQEDERARISRNLHDDLGQVLTGLRIQLTTLELLGAPPLVKECLKTIDLGVDQLRTIAYDLRPPELDALGLQAALTRMVERRAQEGQCQVRIHFQIDEEPLSAQSEILFRVAQEGMTNILRHAQAEHIYLHLSQSREKYRLKIYDDGVGIPEGFDTQKFGIGLLGAQARVKEKGGRLALVSVSELRGEVGGVSPSEDESVDVVVWKTVLSLSLPCAPDYFDLIGSPLPR